MQEGIDHAVVVLVCVTREYLQRVAQKENPMDACKRAFKCPP